jgi:primosomal protein N' (replication factor Y)
VSTVQVAVPAPLRYALVYRSDPDSQTPVVGARVLVPLRNRTVLGVVAAATASAQPKLKTIAQVLDTEPAITPEIFRVASWCSDYYHHALGEVLQTALPGYLRRAVPLPPPREFRYRATDRGARSVDSLPTGATVQRRVLEALVNAGSDGLSGEAARQLTTRSADVLRRLEAREFLQRDEVPINCVPLEGREHPPELTAAQAEAVEGIGGTASYATFLVNGVTGSGKTEVYLRLLADVVEHGRQGLLLVPEISLTPQLIERLRRRLSGRLAVLHSGLTDRERHRAWWLARQGDADIVLGTRSAVFTPLPRLGMIIIDEEHDLSFKQQEGFRYHARDVAVKRAQLKNIPIVLGSATPSLESLGNVERGRYQEVRLPDRTGEASLPTVHLVDLGRDAIRTRLGRREQVLVFVNRRGFAPVLYCVDCSWHSGCHRCDARMTLHRRSRQLRCHYCGSSIAMPSRCPQCGGEDLRPLGEGTQRVEEALAHQFPDARIVRVDSDVASGKGRLEETFQRVRRGEVDIVVGTQMVSKGHDFPDVTLVCVVNADGGLFSLDFRAPERLSQQLIQVAGRAGRAERHGEVMIQTLFPAAPQLIRLQRHDYNGFAAEEMRERREAHYPPYAYLVLLRAESVRADDALRFLTDAAVAGKPHLEACADGAVSLMDPVPSPMERRAGRYRAQLLVKATRRESLHRFVRDWLASCERLPLARRVRWAIDVDPTDMV